jgi:hypothetical protein
MFNFKRELISFLLELLPVKSHQREISQILGFEYGNKETLGHNPQKEMDNNTSLRADFCGYPDWHISSDSHLQG